MRHQLVVVIVVSIILGLLIAAPVMAGKPNPVVTRLSGLTPVQYTPPDAPQPLRLLDTCVINNGGPICYYIYPWIVGDELYKAYQNPGLVCDQPYPFTVTEVHFPLYILAQATIQISVDVEAVDASVPSCPAPGDLLTISSYYEITLDPDLYLITVPLDTPVVVNGPYFVGAYIGPGGNPSDAAVLTDSIPTPCVGYNDWGQGYVDLDTVRNSDDGSKIFPGRLMLYSSGTSGGSGGTQPIPAARFIIPSSGQFLSNPGDLWADDAAGSTIIRQALFHYQSGLSWLSIGSDLTNDPVLRNGVAASGSGNGLSYSWNTAAMSENDYALRVIVSDTLGRADTANVSAHIDPTPPYPTITNPTRGQNICGGVTVQVSCPDEDISYIAFDYKKLPRPMMRSVSLISQRVGGDSDGNPSDSNRVADGEHGDYCSGPAAAAMATKYWYSKGYTAIMTESGIPLTDIQLMERFTAAMKVRENDGTYDDEFVAGLRDYIAAHGNQFTARVDRTPTPASLLTWGFDQDNMVMVGLSGSPGVWLTVSGVDGLPDDSGWVTVYLADPTTTTVVEGKLREDAGQARLWYRNQWMLVDIMVGFAPNGLTVTRQPVGFDASGADGWGVAWNTDALAEDSLYFLTATVSDASGHSGMASVLVYKECAPEYLAGDVDNNGIVNIADMVFLASFLFNNGPAPSVGLGPADVNCDGTVTVADIVYLYKYLFLAGPAPCL